MDDLSDKRPNRIAPVLLVTLGIVFILWVSQQGFEQGGGREATGTEAATAEPGETPSPAISPAAAVGESLPVLVHDFPDGLIVLSLVEHTRAHLFLYHPQNLPLTRITHGDWDDIHPAASPDGGRIAFSSNRGGRWDLYVLDLGDGNLEQITDTPEYDGAPSWSPDGQFLAYETLVEDQLDILITELAGTAESIRLTDDPAADHSPAWSPVGRQIAFVSARSGEPEIWLADLQNTDERFTNLSANPEGAEDRPRWSADGGQLAWASVEAGLHVLYLSTDLVSGQARPAGSGTWPTFSPDGATLLTVLDAPLRQFLAAYPAGSPDLVSLPPLALPGRVRGIDWAGLRIPVSLPAAFRAAAEATPAPLWIPATAAATAAVPGRSLLVSLGDVDAPDPRLLEEVDEAFNALRARAAARLGWDLLATLENAYVSISSPLPPGLGNDWLYTGRAFALDGAVAQAGWIVLVREDYGVQTYWRVYVRARLQDGSQGEPLRLPPFDLNARFLGDPEIYENGGVRLDDVPGGYWVDFTALAAEYGWERLPALLNWRAFFQGARYNAFVFTGGLEWEAAMLDLYPPEALITASPITPVTPTLTPTRTATPSRTPSPTITPTATISPSPTLDE